jgi:hypothetical protein
MFKRTVFIFHVIVFLATFAMANDLPAGYEDPEHGEAHTHIGINWDGISGTSDDNKLWIGSSQTIDGESNLDWPNWSVIELVPQYDELGYPVLNDQGQQLYIAEEPDGWFSAHPENGSWQLGGTDEAMAPEWNISIKRVSATDVFFMLRLNDGQIALNNDGSTESMHKEWEQWLENGTGGYGAWGCHHHISFCAWADGLGQTITATFTAIDAGSTGFAESDPFTIQFVTVPEPVTAMILACGAFWVRCRQKRNIG